MSIFKHGVQVFFVNRNPFFHSFDFVINALCCCFCFFGRPVPRDVFTDICNLGLQFFGVLGASRVIRNQSELSLKLTKFFVLVLCVHSTLASVKTLVNQALLFVKSILLLLHILLLKLPFVFKSLLDRSKDLILEIYFSRKLCLSLFFTFLNLGVYLVFQRFALLFNLVISFFLKLSVLLDGIRVGRNSFFFLLNRINNCLIDFRAFLDSIKFGFEKFDIPFKSFDIFLSDFVFFTKHNCVVRKLSGILISCLFILNHCKSMSSVTLCSVHLIKIVIYFTLFKLLLEVIQSNFSRRNSLLNRKNFFAQSFPSVCTDSRVRESFLKLSKIFTPPLSFFLKSVVLFRKHAHISSVVVSVIVFFLLILN